MREKWKGDKEEGGSEWEGGIGVRKRKGEWGKREWGNKVGKRRQGGMGDRGRRSQSEE